MMPGAGERGGSAWIDLFEASREMRFVALERLPEVARALAAAGWVVMAMYEEVDGALAFRAVERRLRCPAGVRGGSDEETAGDEESGEGEGDESRVAHVYEDESSERRSSGSVSVGAGAWWSATLSVPVERGAPRAYVRLARHGVGGTRPEDGGEESEDFAVPASEVDAVLVLLGGVVRQARRNGVLPP